MEESTAGNSVTTHSYFFDQALLPSGWAASVRVDVASGAITNVTPDAPRAGAQHLAGLAVPGLPNLHCHAFQRGMALPERSSSLAFCLRTVFSEE